MSQAPPQYGSHEVFSSSTQAYPQQQQQQQQSTGVTQDPYYPPAPQNQAQNDYPIQQPAQVQQHGDYEKQSYQAEPNRVSHPSGYYHNNNDNSNNNNHAQSQNVNNTQQTHHDIKNNAPPSGFQNVIPLASLSSSSAPVACPKCHQRTMTRAEIRSGNTTHAWAAVAFCVACLCCIPYLISGTKDVEHSCGNCGVRLATWHRSGRTEVLCHA